MAIANRREKDPTVGRKYPTGRLMKRGARLKCHGCNSKGKTLQGDCKGCKGKGYIEV